MAHTGWAANECTDKATFPHAGKPLSRVRPETFPRVSLAETKDMIMTITIMNRLLRAVALGLAVAGGNIAAEASVRLPGEQMNGMPSLAPMLKQITTSVVTITSAGRAGPVKNFSLDKAQRPP